MISENAHILCMIDSLFCRPVGEARQIRPSTPRSSSKHEDDTPNGARLRGHCLPRQDLNLQDLAELASVSLELGLRLRCFWGS